MFDARAESIDQAGRLPAFVPREFEAYWPVAGWTTAASTCGASAAATWSWPSAAKGRDVCFSCGDRRMSELAEITISRYST